MSTVQLSEKEIAILKILVTNRGGTAKEIHSKWYSSSDFISVLRIIHGLHRKDLLLQIRAGGESIYKVSEKGLKVLL
jgi:predicted transcriptional regulator